MLQNRARTPTSKAQSESENCSPSGQDSIPAPEYSSRCVCCANAPAIRPHGMTSRPDDRNARFRSSSSAPCSDISACFMDGGCASSSTTARCRASITAQPTPLLDRPVRIENSDCQIRETLSACGRINYISTPVLSVSM